MNGAPRTASLSDAELVTLAESLPEFQRAGIARDVLLRLANRAGHAAAESDPGALRQGTLLHGAPHRARYNGRR